MELMVRDGDYVIDENGALRRAEGSQELLQRVMWKLSIPRGSFPPLPELGSELYQLSRCKPSQRESMARQYAAQALADEPELTVTAAELGAGGALRLHLDWRGEYLTLTMELGGW